MFSATAIIATIHWDSILQKVLENAAQEGSKGLLSRLQKTDLEKATKRAIGLFSEEWCKELEANLELSSALPGYQDQLKKLIEQASPEIAEWMSPETTIVDLSPVERIWNSIGLDPLPEGFNWALVAQNFARAIRRSVKNDSAMRDTLSVALQERLADAAEKLAGPHPGFDLKGYRDYLEKRCKALQLGVVHTSSYDIERKVTLWSVFIEQNVRESVPTNGIPREALRRLRESGYLEFDASESTESYSSGAERLVLEVVARERLLVIAGNPGSGKSSLLKYIVLRWINENQGPIPLLIDLREYVKERRGIAHYCQNGRACFSLDAREVEAHLHAGKVAIYFDGLDEIFDIQDRRSVVEEITTYVSRFPKVKILITTRIVGYEPERLRSTGFFHVTLQDLDEQQRTDFIHRWHLVAEEDQRERDRLQERLHRALAESEAITELAGNPLLLTMMAILSRNQELPRDRVELYREASRVLLHEWDASRALPVDTFARQEKEDLLLELAGEMQQAKYGLAGNLIERSALVAHIQRFLEGLGIADGYEKALELVHQLTERNFILSFVGADYFSFVHRTFLEYYCAAWFADHFQKRQDLTLDQLKEDVFEPHWRDENWHEVLRLITGMLSEKKAEELIKFLISQDGKKDNLSNVLLAAGCFYEIRNRRAIQTTGLSLWQKLTCEAIRHVPPSYGQYWEEYGLDTDIRRDSVRWIAMTWRNEDGRLWLITAAADDPDPVVRRAAIDELVRVWKEHPETHLVLRSALMDDTSIVRGGAADGIFSIEKNNPQMFSLMLRMARHEKDEFDRMRALYKLNDFWHDNPETLAEIKAATLSNPDSMVRYQILVMLISGREHDEAVREFLWHIVMNEEPSENWDSSVWLIASTWGDRPDTKQRLRELAMNSSSKVGSETIKALSNIHPHDNETLEWLQDVFASGSDATIREAALFGFTRLMKDDPKLHGLLKELAKSSEVPGIRREAVSALAHNWKNDDETYTILLRCVEDDIDNGVRLEAFQFLVSTWSGEPAIARLAMAACRSDSSSEIREDAVRAMHRYSDDLACLKLLEEVVLKDESANVRQAALIVLAQKTSRDSPWIQMLDNIARSDESAEVRRTAFAIILAKLNTLPEISELALDRAQNDANASIRGLAMETLAWCWPTQSTTRALVFDSALSDKEASVRIQALELLWRSWRNDPEALPVVERLALSDAAETVRGAAINLLARAWKYKSEVRGFLMQIVRSSHSKDRLEAARVLTRGWKHDEEVASLVSEVLSGGELLPF